MITWIFNKDISKDHYRDVRKRPPLAWEVPDLQIVGGCLTCSKTPPLYLLWAIPLSDMPQWAKRTFDLTL